MSRKTPGIHQNKEPGQNLASFKAHFLLFSNSEGPFGQWFGYFVISISYLQIMFTNIGFSKKYIPDDESFLSTIVKFLEGIFNFQNILMDDQGGGMLIMMLLVTLYFTVLIISLSLVLFTAITSRQPYFFILKVWSFLILIHPPIVFLLVTNLCDKIFEDFDNNNLPAFELAISDNALFYYSILIYVMNILFAICPSIFLFDILSSKKILATKDPLIDQMTVLQKFIIPLIATLFSESKFSLWMMIGLNFILLQLQLYYYHTILPRNNLKILWLELHLISINSLVVLIIFLVFCLNQIIDQIIPQSSLIVLILLLLPLRIYQTHIHFKTLTHQALFCPYKRLHPYKALYRLRVLQFYRKKMKDPKEYHKYIDNYYFNFCSINAAKEEIFGESTNFTEVNLEKKSTINQIKRLFLEDVVSHYSSNDNLKLILAQFYARTLKLYPLAVKTLTRLKSGSWAIVASAGLLLLNIENQLLNHLKRNEDGLDLYHFIASINDEKDFREEIQSQLTLQTAFWKEHSLNKPDLAVIQKLGQKVHRKKIKIEKKWEYLENKLKVRSHYLYLLYAYYQIILNDSQLVGKEYLKKYQKVNERYAKEPSEELISASNLYTNDNFCVTIRTDPEYAGTIIKCTNGVRKILGYQPNQLVGSNTGMLMNPYIAERHNIFIQNYLKTGHSKFIDLARFIFVKNSSGYLQKASLLVTVHPYIEKEVYLVGLFQAAKDFREYLFVRPNGDIDLYTQGIGEKLGIVGKRINIKKLCPELAKFENAFNYIGFKQIGKEFPDVKENKNSPSSSPVRSETIFSNPAIDNQSPTISPVKFQRRSKLPKSSITLKFGSFVGRVNYENKEEFESIYQKYSSEAQTVKFYPGSDSDNKSTISGIALSYSCKVIIYPVGDSFMKTIEMVNIEEKNNSPGSRLTIDKEFYQTKSNILEQDSSGLSSLSIPNEEEDEKIRGLFSAKKTILKNVPYPSFPHIDQKDADNQGDNSTYIFPATPLVKPIMETSHNSTMPVKILFKDKSSKKKPEKESPLVIQKFLKKKAGPKKSATDSVSVKSNKKAHLNLEKALKAKYYSKAMYIFLLLIFLIFFLLFITQINLYILSLDKMNTTKGLATTLDLANTRVDALTFLARGARASFYLEGNYVDMNTSVVAANGIRNLINGFKTWLPIFTNANNQLRFAIQDIDSRFQAYFREPNIRLFDINSDLSRGSYRLFNTFDANSILAETIFEIREKYYKTGRFDLSVLHFVIDNVANDIFVRTQEAVAIIFSSGELYIDKMSTDFLYYYIGIVFFVTLVTLIILYFLLWTYNSEVQLFRQFLGIPAQEVQLIQDRLGKFERIIISEDYEEFNNFNFETVEDVKIDAAKVSYAKGKRYKTSKHLGFQRKYLLCILVLFAFVVIYVSVLTINYRNVKSEVDDVGIKLSRLQTVQTFLVQATSVSITLGLMSCHGLSYPLRGRSLEEELRFEMERLLSNINILFSTFKDSEGNIDPLVLPIFSDNICKSVSASVLNNCQLVAKSAQGLNFFSFLSYYYSAVYDYYLDYKNSDRSWPTTQRLALFLLEKITLPASVLRDLLVTIIGRVRSDFYEGWGVTANDIKVALIVNIAVFLLLSILIWTFILRNLFEIFNEFKQMMRIAPMDVIIKNSHLKGILIRHSKSILV